MFIKIFSDLFITEENIMYEKPIIIKSGDIAEGVFMASGGEGSDCYTVDAYIHQTPETGRGDYRIQVNAHHDADHNSNRKQRLVLYFNQPVTYSSSNGQCLTTGEVSTLEIQVAYWNNHVDNIGMGDVVVTSEPGLELLGAEMIDEAMEY